MVVDEEVAYWEEKQQMTKNESQRVTAKLNLFF